MRSTYHRLVPLGIQAAWRFPRVNRVRADFPCAALDIWAAGRSFGVGACRVRYDDAEGIERAGEGFWGVYHEGVKYCCCCCYDGGNLISSRGLCFMEYHD